MKIYLETDRLILREVMLDDDANFFALDSDPEVHIYLGNNPVTIIAQSRDNIKNVRQQYIDNGIARWATIEKETNEFIGWSGLKLEKNNPYSGVPYYDLGYRFMKKYWGKGYATEASLAAIDYAFNTMKLEEINAIANVDNFGSINVIKKCGFTFVEEFKYSEDIQCNWYCLNKYSKLI